MPDALPPMTDEDLRQLFYRLGGIQGTLEYILRILAGLLALGVVTFGCVLVGLVLWFWH